MLVVSLVRAPLGLEVEPLSRYGLVEPGRRVLRPEARLGAVVVLVFVGVGGGGEGFFRLRGWSRGLLE